MKICQNCLCVSFRVLENVIQLIWHNLENMEFWWITIKLSQELFKIVWAWFCMCLRIIKAGHHIKRFPKKKQNLPQKALKNDSKLFEVVYFTHLYTCKLKKSLDMEFSWYDQTGKQFFSLLEVGGVLVWTKRRWLTQCSILFVRTGNPVTMKYILCIY